MWPLDQECGQGTLSTFHTTIPGVTSGTTMEKGKIFEAPDCTLQGFHCDALLGRISLKLSSRREAKRSKWVLVVLKVCKGIISKRKVVHAPTNISYENSNDSGKLK